MVPFGKRRGGAEDSGATIEDPRAGDRGSIDREELVVATRPRSPQAEQFRRLRNSLHALNPDGASRSVLLTSSVEGEGKSVAALNLGLALVELPNLRVCVVDANRANPSVEDLLGVPKGPGLTEALAGQVAVLEVVRPTARERLDVLGAGAESADLALNVDRMGALLNAMKRAYDYVLIDAPAVLSSAQPSLLASIADGILFVVRVGETPKLQVEEALTMIEGLGGNVLGTCATGVQD